MKDLYNELMEMVIEEDTIEEYKERRSLQEGVLDKNVQQFLMRSKAEKKAENLRSNQLKKSLKKNYITNSDIYKIIDLSTPFIIEIKKKYNLEKMIANFNHPYLNKGSSINWINTFKLIPENSTDIDKITTEIKKMDKSIISNKGKYKVTKIDTFVDKKNDGKDYIFVLVYLDNTYLK